MWSIRHMYLEDTLLMMPGPVTVTPRVLRAMSKPMINHRSAEFAGIYTDCREIQEALHIVKEEGMEARVKRHRVFSEAIRAAVAELNIEMFPQLKEYSHYYNTVSAMKAPTDVNGDNIKNDVKSRGVIIAGGQECLKNKIFRIGCMGNVTKRDVLSTIQKLEIVLNKRGYIDSLGAGI